MTNGLTPLTQALALALALTLALATTTPAATLATLNHILLLFISSRVNILTFDNLMSRIFHYRIILWSFSLFDNIFDNGEFAITYTILYYRINKKCYC